MVLTLLVPLRRLLRLEDIITVRHVELMCKVTLATGSIVGYAYAMEFFIAWYSGNPNESFHFMNRALGPYNWAWLLMVIPNVVVPQVFWFKKCRQTLWFVFIISIVVNVGMWFERFVIIVIGLHREFLPSNWAYYHPTWVDICTYIGTFGLFFTCFLLFIRFLPMIAISEVKGVTAQADPHHPAGGAKVEEKIPDEEAAV
jgi:molybdopterin-containing oxidoreductase family membrane subunit